MCRGLEKALDQMDGSWQGPSKAQQPSTPAGPQAGVQASSDGAAPAAAGQEPEQQQAQAGVGAAAKVGGLVMDCLGVRRLSVQGSCSGVGEGRGLVLVTCKVSWQ